MPHRHSAWKTAPGRREAIRAFTGFLAGSPLLSAFQQDPFRDHSRVPKLEELVTPFDFEPVAYAKLPRFAYDYTAYGEGSEFTLRRNRQAFDWVKLVPGADSNSGAGATPVTATTILGTPTPSPIMISPTAAHQQLHPEGEMATYQGAAAAADRQQCREFSVREDRDRREKPALVSALPQARFRSQS
jgi:hypothetical protein